MLMLILGFSFSILKIICIVAGLLLFIYIGSDIFTTPFASSCDFFFIKWCNPDLTGV